MVGKGEDDHVEGLVVRQLIVVNLQVFFTKWDGQLIDDEPRIQVFLDDSEPVLEVHQGEEGCGGRVENKTDAA